MKKKIFLIILAVILLLAAIGGGGFYYLYSRLSKPVVSSDPITLTYHDNGTVVLGWPAPLQGGSAIRLYIYDVDRMEYEYLGEYSSNAAELKGLDVTQNYVLKMEAVKYSSLPFVGEKELISEEARTISVYARDMHAPEVTYTTNPSNATATLYWDKQSKLSYEVYSVEGNVYTGIHNAQGDSSVINFGTDVPMPEHDQPESFAVRARYSGVGYDIYSDFSVPVSIDRQELLPTVLEVTASALTERSFSITWNETRGECYRVQKELSNGEWETEALISKTGDRTYETGTLPSSREATFRVISCTDENTEDFAATPAEITVKTGISSTYCTIWPTKDLTLYSDEAMTASIGTVPSMTALCVISESGDVFRVMYGGQFGYISSSWCMIDLQEYLGDTCLYNITNSYSSIFNVHEYPIKDLTGTVVKGYSHVQEADGTFIVPYLYPCAQKLRKAAEAASEQGYIFRIYDAFRPNEASRMMYDTAALILNDVINSDDSTVSKSDAASGAAVGETYFEYMTDHGRYSLGNFLASRASYHNMGIALDMTLVYKATGEEVSMQTGMHDLSWYSEVAQNNSNANILRQIMVDAGFGTLSSEWWHFQDNDTKSELGITSYVSQGASPKGWVLDDNGWKYRQDDGTFLTGVTTDIDGESCTFDYSGYRTGNTLSSQN